MIERITGETELDFHKRIVLGKLVDKTVDEDYSELAELAFGEKSSSDHCRKMMYGSRYTIDLYERFFDELMEENGDEAVLGKIEMANIELRKERVKLQDVKSSYQKLIREQARHETTKEIIENTLMNLELPTLSFNPVMKENLNDNEMLISLNDLHIGALIDNAYNRYNSDIAKDMLEEYFEKIVEVNSVQKCKTAMIWANGDLISGQIHRSITNRETISEQLIIASEIISQFVAAVCGEFESVRWCSVSGNHSRIVPNKEEAIFSDKLDDIIEFYLRARLQNVPNISFDGYEKIDSSLYKVYVKGLVFCGCHGDMDSESHVEVLQKFCGEKLYGVLTGHRHSNRIMNIRNCRVYQSGSLQGIDDYCLSKRIFGHAEQLLLICGADGVLCSYDVLFSNNEGKIK